MRVFAYILPLLFFAQPAAVEDSKKVVKLEKETRNLAKKKTPVDRTKTYVKIADIQLDLAGDAAKREDFEVMQRRISEYCASIGDAHRTMAESGRDPVRKPAGFKDLEIAIRRHSRALEDIGSLLAFEQREFVQKTIQQITDIRDQLMKGLFPRKEAPSRV